MPALLDRAFDPDRFRQQGHQLIDLLADHLATTAAADPPHAIAWRSPADELAAWEQDADAPVNDDMLPLFRALVDRSVNLHSRGFLAHQTSVTAPDAILASLLTGYLNNGMGVFEMGMAGNAIERIVTQRLAQRFGLGPAAGGVITSGGTLGNLTALLAARAARTDCWSAGHGTERLAVMVSAQAHYCIDRAVRIMGLGDAGVISVPVNERFQMRTELLDEVWSAQQAKGIRVLAIVGSACSTATGAYDDLQAIADFAKRRDLWFHVDGAHGAPVIFSPRYAPLVAGIEQADSVVVDLHKMMMVPNLSTALLFRREQHAQRAFTQQAHYLFDAPEVDDWYNSAKRTFECTKPMTVACLYTLLRGHGTELFREYVETTYDIARTFAAQLAADPRFELACAPESNIVCYRFRAGDDAFNRALQHALLEEGQFYIVGTMLNGRYWLRSTLMHPGTTADDLHALRERLSAMAERLTKRASAGSGSLPAPRG